MIIIIINNSKFNMLSISFVSPDYYHCSCKSLPEANTKSGVVLLYVDGYGQGIINGVIE